MKEQAKLGNAKPESSANCMELEDNDRIKRNNYNQERKKTILQDQNIKEPRWRAAHAQ